MCSLKLDLGSEETQALVRALESRVEEVEMDLMDLDIEAFTMYTVQWSREVRESKI